MFGPFSPPPAPEFKNAAQVYQFCEQLSARLSGMALEHEISAEQLRRGLGQIPDGRMGMSSKARARLVAGHLKRAASNCEAASVRVSGAYTAMIAAYEAKAGADRASRTTDKAAKGALSSGPSTGKAKS